MFDLSALAIVLDFRVSCLPGVLRPFFSLKIWRPELLPSLA